jgi:hypothetical protein
VGSLCQRERERCAAERREAPTGGFRLLEGEREGARGLRLGNREELGRAWLLGRGGRGEGKGEKGMVRQGKTGQREK